MLKDFKSKQNGEMTMTDFFYARVSSLDQKNFGLSIQAQIDRAKQLGIPKSNIFVDSGKSAGVKEDMVEYKYDGRHFDVRIDLHNRPEFMRMMTVLKPSNSLYFTKFDRLSRSIHFLEVFTDWCDRKGVILKPLDDSTHKLTRRILSVIAQEELEKTAIRNDDVFRGIYERGGFSFKPPIGYVKNIKTSKGLRFPNLPESSLVPDDRASMVKDIFKQMAQGVHYKKICEQYDIDGRTLYDIVRNRTYLGYTHFKNMEKKTSMIEPLIDEATFKLANANIKSPAPQNIKGQSNTQ